MRAYIPPRVIGPMRDPNNCSKHFIVSKGYRRTCMRAPNISLFQGL